MSVEEINKLISISKRPIDLFGNINEDELKNKYRILCKLCHPDIAPPNKKELYEETMKSLNLIYEQAIKEFKDGLYYVTDDKELYKTKKELFNFKLKEKEYKFYDYVSSSDVDDVYKGICEDKIIFLRICSNEEDNELIDNEYKLLKKLDHQSIPKVISKLNINGKSSILHEDTKGYVLEDLIKYYGPIPGKHVAWILERLLSAVGYLHENKIVHGNIKPENIIVDPETHNVILIDYSLSISDANKETSKYKIVNNHYTPSYVNNKSKVIPNTDIYSIGMSAIYLLGGDIERKAMPISTDVRLRTFIRKMINEKDIQNDAWALWSELIELRNEVYGKKRFQKLNKKLGGI